MKEKALRRYKFQNHLRSFHALNPHLQDLTINLKIIFIRVVLSSRNMALFSSLVDEYLEGMSMCQYVELLRD